MEFALVGKDIGGSLSPLLHRLIDRAMGESNGYILIDTEALDSHILDKLFLLDGFNVTAPFKPEIGLSLKGLDRSADCGAVNTVFCKIGYNTDGDAMLKAVREKGFDFGKVLVLGSGGAARAIAYSFHTCGWEVLLASRSIERGRKAAELAGNGVSFTPLDCIEGAFDIVVNATSVGQIKDCMLLKDDVIKSCAHVFDVVYGKKTFLAVQCERLGKPYADGISMLVYQAIEARRIWGLKDAYPYASKIISEMEKVCKMKSVACNE